MNSHEDRGYKCFYQGKGCEPKVRIERNIFIPYNHDHHCDSHQSNS
jgi:hypothetical protein